MGPAMIIDCSRNPPRAFPSKIKGANVKDAISRGSLLQDSAHPDRSSSIRSERWCLPMSAILDHKPTTSRWTGEPTSRALPAARHFFLLSLPLSLSLSLHPLSCYLWYSFFFFYSVSHSRTRRLTYLAADESGVARQVFGQCAVPAFNLMSNETKVHFTKLTVLHSHEIHFILLFWISNRALKKFYFSLKFFLGNSLLIFPKGKICKLLFRNKLLISNYL